MTKQYEVGYCKPPKHSRFKKGVCANPKGRGRKVEDDSDKYGAMLDRVLNKRIDYTENGKKKQATAYEFLIRKTVASATKGDIKSAESLLKMRANAIKCGKPSPMILQVINALPNDLPVYKKRIKDANC